MRPEDRSSTSFKLNLTAAIVFPQIATFTAAFMLPTNNKLKAKEKPLVETTLADTASEAGISREETAHVLLDKWGTLNLARAVIPGVGFALALIAAL